MILLTMIYNFAQDSEIRQLKAEIATIKKEKR